MSAAFLYWASAALETNGARRENPRGHPVFLFRRRLLADRVRLGRWGQRYCERFLRKKGLATLTRNFACRAGELDLVMAEPDGTIVFVEVKTRTDESFSSAEASVTPAKRKRMIRAARYFRAAHQIDNRPCRFDIVAVILGRSGRPQVRHHPNAFVP